MAGKTLSRDGVLDAVAARSDATIDPKSLAAMLHVRLAELAEIAGVHRTTLSRNATSSEVQARLGPIATILARAANMSGSIAEAVLWFRHQPLPALGGKRATELVRDGEAMRVLAWLDALEDGAYA